MKKFILFMLTIFAVFVLVGCGKTAEKDTFRVALALGGPINDGGWSQSAYEGLLQMEEKLGAEISFSENLKPSDYEKAMRAFAKDGNDVVIGHGFEFGDGAMRLAEEYKDVMFIVTSSDITNDVNVGSLNNNYLQAGFLQGVFAALMTKTNVVAGIGGVDIPPIKNDLLGFVAGAKYINPNIKASFSMVGDWADVNKAKEIALAYISQGADILIEDANEGGKGVFAAAEDTGKYAVGSIGPDFAAHKNLIASATTDMATALFKTAEQIQKGTYKAGFQLMGIKEGIVDFKYSPSLESKIPSEVKDKINEIKDKLSSGEIDVNKYL